MFCFLNNSIHCFFLFGVQWSKIFVMYKFTEAFDTRKGRIDLVLKIRKEFIFEPFQGFQALICICQLLIGLHEVFFRALYFSYVPQMFNDHYCLPLFIEDRVSFHLFDASICGICPKCLFRNTCSKSFKNMGTFTWICVGCKDLITIGVFLAFFFGYVLKTFPVTAHDP